MLHRISPWRWAILTRSCAFALIGASSDITHAKIALKRTATSIECSYTLFSIVFSSIRQ